MNEDTSLFSYGDLQVQLHKPAIVTLQEPLANVLHDSGPDYRTKPPKKPSRPTRKARRTSTRPLPLAASDQP